MQIRLQALMIALFVSRAVLLADGPSEEQRAIRLEKMRSLAESVRFYDSVDQTSQDAALKIQPKHIFRFNDVAREFHDATIWAYGDKGRPAALMAVERYKKFWSLELVSLSTTPISAVSTDGWRWSTKDAGLVYKLFRKAPADANSKAARLRQMKAIARMFQAEERRRSGQRYKLRLLTQPIHRYADAESGIIDGAMFVFGVGTNPEAICLIECIQQTDDTLAWRYAWAPLSGAEVSASLDNEVVWKYAHAGGQKTPTPYSIIKIPIETTSPPKSPKKQ